MRRRSQLHVLIERELWKVRAIHTECLPFWAQPLQWGHLGDWDVNPNQHHSPSFLMLRRSVEEWPGVLGREA